MGSAFMDPKCVISKEIFTETIKTKAEFEKMASIFFLSSLFLIIKRPDIMAKTAATSILISISGIIISLSQAKIGIFWWLTVP